MYRFSLFLVLLLLATGPLSAAPWSATLYAGPATANDTSQILLHGNFRTDGAMIGLALDRDLFKLGSGFSLEGEGEFTQFAFGRDYSTAALGLGLRYSFDAPISLALFTGPSWSPDPPIIATGSFHGAPIKLAPKPWLEYVGAEMAIRLQPGTSAVLRFYHRSGAFGLFADNADEGSMVGMGIRQDF